MKTNVIARLEASKVEALVGNSPGNIAADVQRALKSAKYEVKPNGGFELKVANGSPKNIANLLKRFGWTSNPAGNQLTHPSSDYYMKLSQSGDVTTIRIVD
jgi:hypothetical protein